MVEGSCHCRSIVVQVLQLPEVATKCNCSICRRYGATWLFCSEKTVLIRAEFAPTKKYHWGQHYIDFHHCTRCGCVTHYTSTPKAKSDRIGVNLNIMPCDVVNFVSVRRFDGADTWEYLD